jgi:hypothetical protein
MNRFGVLAFGFILLASGARADEWNALANRPFAGITAERWNHVLDHFREKPYTRAEIQPSLDILATASAQGLPVNGLWNRLEEGVVKRATPSVLHQQVAQRLTHLIVAHRLVMESGFTNCAAPIRQDLTDAVAQALESGLNATAVRRPLQAAAGQATARVKTAVEAGESLYLTGVDDATVGALMEDYLARGLGRGEMLRATSRAIQLHRQGLHGDQIRAALWSSDTTTSENHPPRPRRGRSD